jgi:N-acetylneuraminic acid mutarotase
MMFAVGCLFVAAALAAASAADIGAARVVSLPAVPDRHGFAGAFAGVHNGNLVAGGGTNFPDGVRPWNGGKKVWHDRVFALAPANRARWREIGRLPMPNAYGVSLTIAEGVLMIGGGDADRNFSEVWLMTLERGTLAFRPLPALPTPLAQMAGAAVGRFVHVSGGIERPDAISASARQYRLDLDAIEKGWQAMPPMPAPGRILAIAASDGDAFYVFGGCSLAPDRANRPSRTYLRDAWRFSAGAWTRLADLPTTLAAAASPAPVFDRSVYVISGDDGTQIDLPSPADHKGFSRAVLRYDTITNVWHQAGQLELPAAVTLPTAPWKDGFVCFNGEVRPGVRTTQVFLLHRAR